MNKDTVIVVCGDLAASATMVERLTDAGYGVIGPASSGSMALLLAAQAPATMAVVASGLSDGRLGRDLARDLMVNWGVRSMVLESEELVGDDWTVAAPEAARLNRALLQQADPTLA